MAAIDTEKFCASLAERPGWDGSKIARLEIFLRKEEVWGGAIPLEKIAGAISRFTQEDAAREGRVSPPEDASLTDAS